MQAVLGALPPEARKTISFDTGAEFAPHRNLTAALATEAFFRDPHSPWQRGTIETTNGIFRRPPLPPALWSRQPPVPPPVQRRFVFGAALAAHTSVPPWEPTQK